ncbi:MAG: FtsX-like permease family protein [Acidobacteria bacterium]|nr:FtsX-like permease family protein [Acidobacteriota bacterium]
MSWRDWLPNRSDDPGFTNAMLGDLEELRLRERAKYGRIRAEWRHARRLLSLGRHFGRGSGQGLLGGLLTDLRSSIRRWAATPTLTVVLALSLGLGIGASTAVFSVVDGVLLSPLPYPEADRLIVVEPEFPGQGGRRGPTSPPEYLDLAASEVFENVGVAWYRPGAMTDDGIDPEDVDMAFVSGDFLQTLGVAPLLGRLPAATDDVEGAPKVVLLSHATWQRRYGGDPDIVGRRVAFDDDPHTVIGVMPEDFRMLFPAGTAMPPSLAAWVPWGGVYDAYNRNWRVFTAIGRVSSGADQAQKKLDALAATLRERHGDAYGESGFKWRVDRLDAAVVAPVRGLLGLLFAAAWLVLGVGCANVANLMLARAARDQHEACVRVALGASRWRVLRQALADSALIGGIGVGFGVVLAAAALRVLPALAPADVPRIESVALDWTELGYAGLLSVGVTLVLALLLTRASRATAGGVLRVHRTVASNAAWTRQTLVAAQIALSLVLLVGAGLLLQSFLALAALDPGYEPDGVLTVKLSLVDTHYPYAEPSKIVDFYRDLATRLEDTAGITHAGATSQLPLDGASYSLGPYGFENASGELIESGNAADYRVVTPGLLEAMGTEVVAGRLFTRTDTYETPRVVVIDDQLAKRVWPDEDPVGQQLLLHGGFAEGDERPWAEVVGVVRHLRHHPGTIGTEQIYASHQQTAQRTMTVAMRTDLPVSDALAAVQTAIRELNPIQPMREVRPLNAYLAQALATTRFALDLLVATSLVALVLAVIGTYGIVAFIVSLRVREIGVRMALGASPRRIVGAMATTGARLVAVGVALGIPAAYAFASTIRGLLFEAVATPGIGVLVGSIVLATIGVLAVLVPARRAARLSPVEALRSE